VSNVALNLVISSWFYIQEEQEVVGHQFAGSDNYYNLALTSVHILVLAIRVLNFSARPAIQGDIGALGTRRTSDRAVGLRRLRKRKCTSSLNRALCGTPADIQRKRTLHRWYHDVPTLPGSTDDLNQMTKATH
jgi:hypothetical protein